MIARFLLPRYEVWRNSLILPTALNVRFRQRSAALGYCLSVDSTHGTKDRSYILWDHWLKKWIYPR